MEHSNILSFGKGLNEKEMVQQICLLFGQVLTMEFSNEQEGEADDKKYN